MSQMLRPADQPLRLGLIGDHIEESRSPALHDLAGRLNGIEVSYELLIPARLGESFEEVFESCRRDGFRGLNITYPYKERVLSHVRPCDEAVRAIGSVNTVVFEPDGPVGYNTDHSGFMAAWRGLFGSERPGDVLMFGAGGVGRAIAFALARLGADRIRLVDRDARRTAGLKEALSSIFDIAVEVCAMPLEVGGAVDGIVNCTPVGMSGHGGTVMPAENLGGARWAFDAVYTPVETRFKQDCELAGIRFLSGYELFFHQGVDAFEIFSGTQIADQQLLRAALRDAGSQRRPGL